MKLTLWRRRRREEELEEEIQSHLQMAIHDRMERGESAEEAESAARREFGNVGLIKETTRGMWEFATLETFWRDLRYGARRRETDRQAGNEAGFDWNRDGAGAGNGGDTPHRGSALRRDRDRSDDLRRSGDLFDGSGAARLLSSRPQADQN
jgi:hypothetical protein